MALMVMELMVTVRAGLPVKKGLLKLFSHTKIEKMSSEFPFRPEETVEGFWESFVRISAIAWIVYITFRILNTEWFTSMVQNGGIKNHIPLKASILFAVTIISNYFAASFRTKIYRQSIS